MEPNTTQVTIVSKKKNYDDVNDAELSGPVAQLNSNTDKITYVSLCGNSYSADFCQQFGDILKKLSNLEVANFNDIFVGRKKDEIPRSLECLTGSFLELQVRVLDLSNNAVSTNGAEAISNYLENAKSLRVFHINNCGLGIIGSSTIAAALSKGIAKGNNNLEVISMARNRLENKGTVAMAGAFKNMSNLKEIYLFQDVIREEGMNALLEAVSGKASLEVVDISDNFISDESIENFCKFLETTPNLKTLNMSDCNLELHHAKRVVDSIAASDLKLEKLGFNYAELSDTEHAKKLLDTLLSKNSELKRLDIKGNEFKRAAQEYYKEKAKEQIKYCGFESGDEDEEDDLAKEFSNLKI